MATVTRPSEALPTSGANIKAAQVTDWITNVLSFLESGNIDETNVDLSSSDGIIGKSTAQTITGVKTIDATLVLTGTYLKPLRLAGLRLWYDAANTCLRVKHGAEPSSATDGNILLEG